MRRSNPATIVAAVALLAAGCAPSEQRDPSTTGTAAPADATAPTEEPDGFVNRVWQIHTTGGDPGAFRVFLAGGTLVMASSHATPAFGTWKFERDSLTIVEDGIPYRAAIVSLSENEFHIRMISPGEPVDITLVPAPTPPHQP